MSETNARKSTIRKRLEEGCIAEFYTMEGWFCKVYPVLSIDMVKFSFAKKGSGGKGFDVWINTDTFSELCDEIQSNVLMKKIANDNESEYPNAWKVTSGENGCKELNIGKGRKGCVLQGKDKSLGKEGNAFIGITYDALKNMAAWWNRISVSYYEEMSKIFLKAMESSSRYFSQVDESEVASSVSASPVENTPNENYEKIALITTTTLQVFGSKGNLCFKAKDSKQNEKAYTIGVDDISTFDSAKWESFKNAAENKAGVNVTIYADTNTYKDRVIVKNIL